MDDLDTAQRLQLDALTDEYYRQHGVAVAMLKDEVGPGDVYTNTVARAVVSRNGAWCECIDLPMEFSGASGGPVTHRLVDGTDALTVLDGLHQLAARVNRETTRQFGLFVLYARTGIADGRNVWAVQYAPSPAGISERPHEVGAYRPGALPLFFRYRIDTDLDAPGLNVRSGLVFFLSDVGERNLLVEMPYDDEGYLDLGNVPPNPATQ